MTNDTDADSQRLTASLVAGPAHGTLTLDANGGFTYAPTHNYNGTDSFTYKVNDGTADSNIATVALTVTAVNDAPIANSDINGVVVGKTVRADAAHGVLANDADPEGDALHVSAVDGVEDLMEHIAAAQRFMPGLQMQRRGEVRHCQGTALADWVAVAADGQERATGTNVFVFDADGRIEAVTGFWRL